MRLLHVTQAYYPFLERGGPTVKVRALARGLVCDGCEVTVLSADLGFDRAKQESTGVTAGRWGFEAKENGVEAIYLRTRARYRSRRARRGLRRGTRQTRPATILAAGLRRECRVRPR